MGNLCVFNNATLWNEGGHKEFGVGDICKNNRTFYSHVVYNESVVEKTYYLHFRKYWKFMDDTELTSQWVMSIDSMNTAGSQIAWCDEHDLINCVANKWIIESVAHDLGELIVETSMAVSNQACASVTDANDSEMDSGVDVSVWIVIIVGTVAIIACGALMFLYFRRKNSKFATASKVVSIADEEVDDAGMEDEIIIDYEVDGGNTQ